jgi:hypothetical protein
VREFIDLPCKGKHELDASAGNDEGLEAVRAQIREQLDRWLAGRPSRRTKARIGGPVAQLVVMFQNSSEQSLLGFERFAYCHF